MEVLDPASSAAACAAFCAETAEVFCASGSGGPGFCIAGFGRNLARRKDSATTGWMGRESIDRTGAFSRAARSVFPERKRMATQISAAAARSNSKNPRRAVGLSSENIMHESSRCNLAVVKRGNDDGYSRSATNGF
jgi:hypothetical protein